MTSRNAQLKMLTDDLEFYKAKMEDEANKQEPSSARFEMYAKEKNALQAAVLKLLETDTSSSTAGLQAASVDAMVGLLFLRKFLITNLMSRT